ncbi:MAG: cysteine hydrolase [Burkholderiales bacterium]|nr:cysteine hydrolase [Burkholderiales bacterium]
MNERRQILGALIAAASAACLPTAAAAHSILDEWGSVQTPPPPSLSKVTVDPKTTALLVLDLSKDTCNREVRPRCVAALPQAGKLLATARAKGWFVVYTLGALPTPGTPADLWPDVALVGHEPWVRSGPDKYLGTDLEKILRDRGITTVVIIGTASHGAVLYTAGGSVFRGFNVVIAVDGVTAESTYAEQYTLWHLQNAPRMAAKVKLSSTELID